VSERSVGGRLCAYLLGLVIAHWCVQCRAVWGNTKKGPRLTRYLFHYFSLAGASGSGRDNGACLCSDTPPRAFPAALEKRHQKTRPNSGCSGISSGDRIHLTGAPQRTIALTLAVRVRLQVAAELGMRPHSNSLGHSAELTVSAGLTSHLVSAFHSSTARSSHPAPSLSVPVAFPRLYAALPAMHERSMHQRGPSLSGR
jgi:hypothetical protein